MTLYNLYFQDHQYNTDKQLSISIIEEIEGEIEILKQNEFNNKENIENKKLIIKILKYQFSL